MGENLVVPTVVDVLYEAIRDRILIGEMEAGTALTEKEVSTSYGVARPTAKAALQRLIYEGLLRQSTNKSARVPTMTADDIVDLYRIRSFLEREAMEVVAERRKIPPEATAASQRMHSVIKSSSLTQVVEADVAFHRALVDSLESPRLSRMYLSIMGETRLCMAQVQSNRLLHPTVIATEHDHVVRYLEAGEGGHAVEEMRLHLTRARDQLLRRLNEPSVDDHVIAQA